MVSLRGCLVSGGWDYIGIQPVCLFRGVCLNSGQRFDTDHRFTDCTNVAPRNHDKWVVWSIPNGRFITGFPTWLTYFLGTKRPSTSYLLRYDPSPKIIPSLKLLILPLFTINIHRCPQISQASAGIIHEYSMDKIFRIRHSSLLMWSTLITHYLLAINIGDSMVFTFHTIPYYFPNIPRISLSH